MKNILRKYSVWEYVFFIIGLSILGKITYSFIKDTLENTVLNGIALIVGILLLAAPSTLVEIVKKKANENTN